MILADVAGHADLHEGHRLWAHIQGWAAELGLTGPGAIARTAQHPAGTSHDHDHAAGQPDREAAD